jgi:hypothetical protein
VGQRQIVVKPRKPLIHSKTVVWRISEGAPGGEWVEKAAAAPPPPKCKKPDLPEVSDGSWVTSSFDLLSGSDAVEVSDTIPGDLFDELFAPPPKKNETKAADE